MNSLDGGRLGVRLQLRRYLASRLGPLAVVLVVVVCTSAPLAFHVLGRRALRLQAAITARQIAQTIERDAQARPLLWSYDSARLLEHIRGYELYEGVDRIDVVDARGRRVDAGDEPTLSVRRGPVVWEQALIVVPGADAGQVWVAVSTAHLRLNTYALLGVFGLLGLLLGGLMYGLPMRAIARAQSQIGGLLERLEKSQAALAELNETLEHQVDARSSELRQAYRELEDKERHLRDVSSRAVSMQEAERRAIARELHDSAGQSLTAIRIHLQLMGDLLGSVPEDSPASQQVAKLAGQTTSMVDEAVEEIRRAVNQLGPAVLDDVGLADAIERAADDTADALAIRVRCELDLPSALEPSLETTVYRLVQEALTNIARHAEAEHVDIGVGVVGDRLVVRVRDDGCGFDPADRRHNRRGLVGMRERVELLGGSLAIDSSPGHGTTVEASLPRVVVHS